MASVYPVARGSAPLLVTIGAAIFAGELPGMLGLSGIALVSLGIMALALRNTGADAKSIGAALAAGLFIASYMVADGLGVRLAGECGRLCRVASGCGGISDPAGHRPDPEDSLPKMPRGKEGATVVGAGILAMLGYAIAVWAMSLTTMGGVSAIRESSILFAALIGIFVLGEKMTLSQDCRRSGGHRRRGSVVARLDQALPRTQHIIRDKRIVLALIAELAGRAVAGNEGHVVAQRP